MVNRNGVGKEKLSKCSKCTGSIIGIARLTFQKRSKGTQDSRIIDAVRIRAWICFALIQGFRLVYEFIGEGWSKP